MGDFELFGVAWFAMFCAAVSLSLLGIFVVARNHMMSAIAAGQSAACGAAMSMFLIGLFAGNHVHGDPRIYIGAICGGLLGTALSWTASSERAAWLFAAAGVGTMLLIAQSPYGMHDILALQHSNALLAQSLEAYLFCMLCLLVIICLCIWHRPLRLLVIDPNHAHVTGIATRKWQRLLGLSIGLLLSLAVNAFGLLYAFSCLILPCLIAAKLSPSFWPLFILSPLIAGISIIVGILIGHSQDLPPGQSASAVLAIAYPIAAGFGNLLRRYTVPAE